MPTIDIIIRNKTASAVNPPCIVCGNSDYNVKFNFDEEWQAHNNKIGVFAYNRCGEWQSEKVLFEGDTCPVPALHGVRSVWIGVTAGDVRTSTPADVPCRMGATDFSDTTEKPSADIWGQILDKLDSIGAGSSTPDWAQNDPNGAGYIKNRCGGYDDMQTKESELLSFSCPANTNTAMAYLGRSFFPPSAGDIIAVTVDGSTKEYTLAEGTFNGESVLWFGTQNPSGITNPNAFFASDKWLGGFKIDESDMIVVVSYGSLSEIVGKTVGLKQRRVLVAPVKISRRYLDVPDWAKADSRPTYTANDVGAVPTDSVTTAVNAESTNESVPTAKTVYGALQDIDIPSGTDISLGVTATVGQTIKVKAVDADGKPTAWEAVDMATGETEVWETLAEATLKEESVPILDIGAMASSFSRLRFYFTFPIVESVEKAYVSLAIPNSTTGPAYNVALIKRGNDKSESWAFIDFYPLLYNGICYMRMIESAKVGITYDTTQQFQYNSYDYYRISEARYARTSKPLPTGATITILGVRK